MASAPMDPLQALQAAMNLQANSNEQAEILTSLRESLEAHPGPIPILVGTLLGTVVNAADSLFKRWVIDLLHFAISRSSLSVEHRTQMASQTLETLAQLLEESNPAILKVVIQCLTGVYPLLFRLFCSSRTNPGAWQTLSHCKAKILEFVWAANIGLGVKLSSVKFLQRVVLVQTRGISDPRLQNKNDPNIAMCPADHPFLAIAKLEAEGQKLLEGVITLLYTSQNVDLLSALLNSWANLAKLRPAVVPAILAALRQWNPASLTSSPASGIKSVEKSIRILLAHISRNPNYNHYVPQINEILASQAVRLEKAVQEEKRRKAAIAENRKRPLSAPIDQAADAKRLKLEADPQGSAASAYVATFDFTTLPPALITDLIVANLEAFSEAALVNFVQVYRQNRGLAGSIPSSLPGLDPGTSAIPPPLPTGPKRAQTFPERERSTSPPPPVAQDIKDEPIDPLQMDIDQDEIEYEPDRLNEELSGEISAAGVGDTVLEVETLADDLKMISFKLPPPREWNEDQRIPLINSAIERICIGAEDFISSEITASENMQNTRQTATDMWMLLLIRMITRVAEPPLTDGQKKDIQVHEFTARQDKLRQVLCDYIMQDFPSRLRLATTWMNEEWYNDWVRTHNDMNHNWQPNFDTWLNQIVVSYQVQMDGKDGKDRTFSRFLLDLPHIPPDVLALLRELCVEFNCPDRMQVGFTTLRGLVMQRPSLRGEALNVLLELTTHSEKKTRGAAINSVKLWVPNVQPMDSIIRDFALQMLRKLQVKDKVTRPKSQSESDILIEGRPDAPTPKDVMMEGRAEEKLPSEKDEPMEDGQLPVEELVQTPYLPERIELPADKSQVLQHVELLFALSVKVPTFLDEIFIAYSQMDVTVQDAIQDLITALIRSLGSSHGKLLTLMRTCPPGSESLALRVLTIFTEHGRPSPQLVALVKALINERDLDARFLVPIIAEMDKPDILRHLPRIVSMLNGQQERKNIVRNVFSSIVTAPPQTFGSVTSNQPRVQQSEELTPTELMVLLHNCEKEIGLKSAIEAIGICFSMTDVFRSEVLAAVMQQIVDELVLPTLFMRTVIQAVTTYKTLVGYVSTTLLSRLIIKKIWTIPALWEGFIRCAKVIAPASFGALLQLPKDQLRELLDKQPGLKAGLRTYVIKKAPSKARGPTFTEIFGEALEDDSGSNSTGQADMAVAASA